MAPVAATRNGRGSSSIFRGVLSGVLLVAAVIVGLLGMHTVNLHGTAAADAPATVAMSVSEPASTHHGTAQVQTPAHAQPQTHPSGSSTSAADTSCAGCGTDDHAGMAMMCVLALLLALLLLIAPAALRRWSGAMFRPPFTDSVRARLLARAPSLHVLCISRT